MRSRLIKIPTAIIFLLLTVCSWSLVSQVGFADTLYVATNGNNQRSRSQAQNRSTPWQTIQRASCFLESTTRTCGFEKAAKPAAKLRFGPKDITERACLVVLR